MLEFVEMLRQLLEEFGLEDEEELGKEKLFS